MENYEPVTNETATSDKEPIYDDLIHPLMDQIIAICKEHEIRFIASFQLRAETAEEPARMCTTSMTHPPCADCLQIALKQILPKETWRVTAPSLARTKSDGGQTDA